MVISSAVVCRARGDGPKISCSIAAASRAGLSAMGLVLITAGATACAAAVELRLAPELLRLRERLSLSSAGVAGRTAVNTVAVRRRAPPIRADHLLPPLFVGGVPGGVAIVVYTTAVQDLGEIDIDEDVQ